MGKSLRKGFTIIEVLVLLFIFLVITVTFYRFFASGTNLMLEAKKKLMATNVANERLELIRSMRYNDIGTVSGVPEGDIDSDENLTYSGYQFNVLTSITYHDDPFDNGGGDAETNDYKKVTVTVSWGSRSSTQTVSASTIIAPFGEEVGIGGGTLNINVSDMDGEPVSGVSINVSNPSVSYNQNVTTDARGFVSLIGLTPSTQRYVITLSKSDYENGIRTYPPYPTSTFYPNNVHATVIMSSVSNSVFVFNRKSDFKLKFINPIGDVGISSVDFAMSGGRVLGTKADGSLAYNYDNGSLTSSSSGEFEIENASPGSYKVTVNESGYIFWKTDSGSRGDVGELVVAHGETGQTKKVLLLNENTPSYFVRIVDSVDASPIEGAQVVVSNDVLLYEETVQTDQYGYAFISIDPAKPLLDGQTYEVEVSKDGDYNNESRTVTIDKLTEETIPLDPL